MHLNLVVVGKTQLSEMVSLEKIYEQKIRLFTSFTYHLVAPKKKLKDTVEQRKHENQCLIEKLAKLKGIVWLLDELGKEFTSVEFATQIKKIESNSQTLNLVIGGAYGFTPEFKQQYPNIALSKMTFTHDMVRVFALEQIYRAFSILRNKKYHH